VRSVAEQFDSNEVLNNTFICSKPLSSSLDLDNTPSRDLCASTATRRRDVFAAGDLLDFRLCFWFSDGRSLEFPFDESF
jgi:hypothetical protein